MLNAVQSQCVHSCWGMHLQQTNALTCSGPPASKMHPKSRMHCPESPEATDVHHRISWMLFKGVWALSPQNQDPKCPCAARRLTRGAAPLDTGLCVGIPLCSVLDLGLLLRIKTVGLLLQAKEVFLGNSHILSGLGSYTILALWAETSQGRPPKGCQHQIPSWADMAKL